MMYLLSERNTGYRIKFTITNTKHREKRLEGNVQMLTLVFLRVERLLVTFMFVL